MLPATVYQQIKTQRDCIVAPVDKYGCSSTQEYNVEKRNFTILVSLLLSSQTRDEVTHAAVQTLEQKIAGGVCAESVSKQSVASINACICKVGFHKKKSVYLKSVAEICAQAGIPDTLEDLIKLPGIGYKMAILYLYHACGKVAGISVDTHVHRVANRIGWVTTKNPRHTQKALEKILPPEEWASVNRVLVGFGQVICRPVKPKCLECSVSTWCKAFEKYSF